MCLRMLLLMNAVVSLRVDVRGQLGLPLLFILTPGLSCYLLTLGMPAQKLLGGSPLCITVALGF